MTTMSKTNRSEPAVLRALRAGLMAGAFLLLSVGCAPDTQVESAGASPGKLSNDDAEGKDEPRKRDTDCTKSSCAEVKFKLRLVDMKTGSNVTSFRGESIDKTAWGVEPERVNSSGPEREVQVTFDDLPSALQKQLKQPQAAAVGTFIDATSGSLKVRWRDMDMCRVKHSKIDECDNIDKAIAGIDKTESVSYTIDRSTKQEQMDQAEQQAKTAEMMGCGIGIFGAFMGKMDGITKCLGMVMK